MMREIKFDLVVKNIHTGYINHKKYALSELMHGVARLFDVENYEILAKRQFTGLKDKNGVDVFEGDLLICPSGDYHEVIFESYFATFNTRHIKSGEVSDITKDEMEECFEQCGNIYEHKHLIGEG